MSDIPSNLSKWEPPRWLKVLFLATVLLSFGLLFGWEIYNETVVYKHKMEQALDAEAKAGPAPPFTLTDASNHEVSLQSLRGKVVFLNFWASWCGPCREEMPSLAELASQMDPRDTAFVAVSVDDDWAAVRSFLDPGQEPYRVLLDSTKKVAQEYGTIQYPESYIIGPDGRLLYKFVGAKDWSNVAAIKLLELAGSHRRPPQPEAPAPSAKS